MGFHAEPSCIQKAGFNVFIALERARKQLWAIPEATWDCFVLLGGMPILSASACIQSMQPHPCTLPASLGRDVVGVNVQEGLG